MLNQLCHFFLLTKLGLAIEVSFSNGISERNIPDTSLKDKKYLQFDLNVEQDTYYSTTLEIGTPSQNVTVLFDTGSADTWLMSSNNIFCREEYDNCINENNNCNLNYNNEIITSKQLVDCSTLEKFDANISSTFQQLGKSRFYIQYADKTFADGIWGVDTFKFGEAEVKNVQFGLANYATTPIAGVLGIGFQRRESVKHYENAPNKYYDNFPQILQNEGIIDSVAYSLSLDGQSSILFGAFDQGKIDGELVTFPMINMFPDASDKPTTLSITLQGISFKNEIECQFDSVMANTYPALIDSGSTFMFFPQEIADKLADYANATWSDSDGIYLMNCLSDDNFLANETFVFDFGDIHIEIPLSALVLSSDDGSNVCGFAIQRGENEVTFGDLFLKFAYTIFDLDHYQITLGKMKKNPDSTEIVTIPSNGKIKNARTATAKRWSTYEPFTANPDKLINERKSCSVQNASSRKPSTTSVSKTQAKPNTLKKKVRTITETTVIVKYSTVRVCGSSTLN